MKFLCLGYYDPAMDARPATEIEAIMSQCHPHLQAFYATGQVLMDAGLDPPARRLRNVDGLVAIEEGAVAPHAPAIGSATVIEAPDLDAAVALPLDTPARRWPQAPRSAGRSRSGRSIRFMKGRRPASGPPSPRHIAFVSDCSLDSSNEE
jgi:hypothetical protein